MPGADLRFTIFARGWSLAILLGLMSQGMAITPARIVVCVLATSALLFPSQPVLLLGLASAFVVHFAIDTYPHAFVHLWICAVTSTASAWVLLTSFDWSPATWRQRFIERFAPIGVALAGFWLLAAGFAKLNSAFADPLRSCATVFYEHQRTYGPFRLLPGAPWAEALAIPFTQVAENLGGLLLLAHWRTRKAGFLLAAPFLLLAGSNPVGRLFEFTSLFLALLSLGFTWPDTEEAETNSPSRLRLGLRWAGRALVIGVVVTAARMDTDPAALEHRYDFARALFTLIAAGFIAVAAHGGRTLRLRQPALPAPSTLAWGLVVIAVAHEALPYVGLRTERNLCMAANLLVVPAESNHWIVRSVPHLPFNHMATLERSSDPWLNRHGTRAWVDWALEDYLARHPDISVRYVLDGEVIDLPRVGDDPRFETSALAHFLSPYQVPTHPYAPRCDKGPPA